jgi:hypothetical protein
MAAAVPRGDDEQVGVWLFGARGSVAAARLGAKALERGHIGAMPFLGFFFKDPIGSREHALVRQYDQLVAWVRG